ncbi:YqzE family protein [Bacillus alkalicellulosilyticus]|uniref:YqzE family protein n=1 Tax=Alkalihalobacterium alkalicellulosilyticum TaxID=1912214 RepID=UPI0009962B77|nr:YqzE family protein [Bacillus alkalicellulosilyticus]
MSFNEIVKYVTQQFVTYVDQPKEQRLASKIERKESKPPLQYHMFGMIPLALSIVWKNSRTKKKEK